MSKRRLSSGGTGGLESNKIPRSSAIQSDSMLQSLDESWAGSAKVCLEPFLGTPTSIALARFLDDVKNSIFKSLRASKDFSEVHVPLGDVEPLDRELAMEVDSLEKEVERLAKQVKDARESARETLPQAIRNRQSSRLKMLTAAMNTVDNSKGSETRGKGRQSSSSADVNNAAVMATAKMTADAVRAQSRELQEALVVNKQKLTALEKDTLQVLAVLESRKK